jgi:hypothetical protein
LVLAAYSNDVLKVGFTAIGLEYNSGFALDNTPKGYHYYPAYIPFSHGLFMSVIWSLVAAGIAYLIFHSMRISGIFGLVVASHWLLDFIVHPPELPLLFSQSHMVGLGLWNSPTTYALANMIEVSMLAGGVILYLNHNINIYFRSL